MRNTGLFKKGDKSLGTYTRTAEMNLARSLRMKGKKHPHKGKPYTPERSREQSIRFSGAGNPMFGRRGESAPNWQGGRTKLSIAIRRSLSYRIWRDAVYRRDFWTCQNCHKKNGVQIHAHHLKSFSKILHENKIKTLEQAEGCEELWDTWNGQTLCEGCHKETDTYSGKNKSRIFNHK